MSDTNLDIAVFGSTPLACLLAGLLASVHGRKVSLVGDSDWAFRLTTGIDLSVAPVTRPETWSLLKASTAETVKLLGRMSAKAAITHVDPMFIAETEMGAAALSHMRYMAHGFGYAVEKVSQNSPTETPGTAYRVRDAMLVSRPLLAESMANWLDKAGVRQLPSQDATIRSDGSARIVAGEDSILAGQAILADDAAILTYLDADAARAFLIEPATSVLTEPVADNGAAVTVYLERGVVLNQTPRGGISVLASGRPSLALPRIGASLAGYGSVRRAGERGFRTVSALDGAALVGSVPGSNTYVLAGFGLAGAFVAPAIARFIAGSASQDEAAYFSARRARDGVRSGIAEYSPQVAGEIQA